MLRVEVTLDECNSSLANNSIPLVAFLALVVAQRVEMTNIKSSIERKICSLSLHPIFLSGTVILPAAGKSRTRMF